MRTDCMVILLVSLVGASCSSEPATVVGDKEEQKPSGRVAAAAEAPSDPAEAIMLTKMALDMTNSTAVTLRYSGGQSLKYSTTVDQKIRQKRSDGKNGFSGIAQGFQIVRSIPASASDQTSWVEDVAFKNVEMVPVPDPEATPEELKQSKLDAMQPMFDRVSAMLARSSFRLASGPRGGVDSFDRVVADDAAPSPMVEALAKVVRDTVPRLAENAVKPGDTWDDSWEEDVVRGSVKAHIRRDMTWKVAGWAVPTAECAGCLLVTGSGTITESGTIDGPGQKGDELGKGVIRAAFLFDVRKGRIEVFEMAVEETRSYGLKQDKDDVQFSEISSLLIRQTLIEEDPNQPKKE